MEASSWTPVLMGKGVRQVCRLFDMIERLADRSYRTQDLAKIYGVSQRTIQRDLLDLAGAPAYVPIWEDAEQPGRVRIMPNADPRRWRRLRACVPRKPSE